LHFKLELSFFMIKWLGLHISYYRIVWINNRLFFWKQYMDIPFLNVMSCIKYRRNKKKDSFNAGKYSLQLEWVCRKDSMVFYITLLHSKYLQFHPKNTFNGPFYLSFTESFEKEYAEARACKDIIIDQQIS
jgi:hypothetical protein